MINLVWVLRKYSELLGQDVEKTKLFRIEFKHNEWAFKACEQIAEILNNNILK